MNKLLDPGSADIAAVEALSDLRDDTGLAVDGETSHLGSITNPSDDQSRPLDSIITGISQIDIQDKQEPSDSKDRKHKLPFIKKAKEKWGTRKKAFHKGKRVEVSIRLGFSSYLRKSKYTENKARANDRNMQKGPLNPIL